MKTTGRNLLTSLPQQISPGIRSGEELAGDNYSAAQISRWFAQEKEAFFADDEGNSHIDPYYAYMRSLTPRLGKVALRHTDQGGRSMLVLGPGPGLEVEVLAPAQKWQITFVEASDNFRTELRRRFPSSRILPAAECGILSADSTSIDLVLTLSVLHHIPNVSFVLGEFSRVLKPGGYAIVREPCSSMGDWRGERSTTPNERGIGRRWMLAAAAKVGLVSVRTPVPILFHPLSLVVKRLHAARLMYTPAYYFLDAAVSRLIQFNDRYWRATWYHKLAPSAYFYVFRKPYSESRSY